MMFDPGEAFPVLVCCSGASRSTQTFMRLMANDLSYALGSCMKYEYPNESRFHKL